MSIADDDSGTAEDEFDPSTLSTADLKGLSESIDDGCAEGIANPGFGTGQGVIQANPECDVGRNRKASAPSCDWRGNDNNQQEQQTNTSVRVSVSHEMLQHR